MEEDEVVSAELLVVVATAELCAEESVPVLP